MSNGMSRMSKITKTYDYEKEGGAKPAEFPDPVCQCCGNIAGEFEEVDVGGGDVELWVYCVLCDCETFHKIHHW